MKSVNRGILPKILLSTIGGHSGAGIPFYCLNPEYNHLIGCAIETSTPLLTKSATFNRHVGNVVIYKPWTIRQYIRRIDDEGMVNAYGLTNPGSAACSRTIRLAMKVGMNSIPNYYPQFMLNNVDRTREALEEIIIAINTYRQTLGERFWIIELNFSCPNSEDQISKNMLQVLACLRTVRAHFPALVIIAKMSYVQPDELFQEISQQGLADYFHNFNTIDFKQLFGRPSPLKNGAGGVSGKPIRQLCFERNEKITKQVKIPTIMGGGVPAGQPKELERYFDIGATCLSLCTSALYHPLHAAALLRTYNN